MGKRIERGRGQEREEDRAKGRGRDGHLVSCADYGLLVFQLFVFPSSIICWEE